MKTFRSIGLSALLVGFVIVGCGDDDPVRPPPLDDLDAALGDVLPALDGGGGSNVDVVYPRYDASAVSDGNGAVYDVTGAQDVGRGGDATTSPDGGVMPAMDVGEPSDSGAAMGPSDLGGE